MEMSFFVLFGWGHWWWTRLGVMVCLEKGISGPSVVEMLVEGAE